MSEIGAKICGNCDCGAAFRINLFAEWTEGTEGDAQSAGRHCESIEIASRLRWRVVWIPNVRTGANIKHNSAIAH